MSDSGFVVREGHFHIADKDSYVLTGWFENEKEDVGDQGFQVFLDREPLKTQVLCFTDSSVQQKYAKYDKNVTKEYVIIAKLPMQLNKYHRLTLCFADGRRVFERSVIQLRKVQNNLNYRISSIQVTGASCVVTGWAASENQIKINVFDKSNVPVQCEVAHYPKPDVALEFREADSLSDSGFSVTVPMSGKKKLILQITDGENSITQAFRAVGSRQIMLYLKKAHYFMRRNGMKNACKRAVNEIYELIGDTGNYMKWSKKNRPSDRQLARQRQEDGIDWPYLYVITPYQNTHSLTELAMAMRNQTYRNWKWVFVCTKQERNKLIAQLNANIAQEHILFVPADSKSGMQQRIAAGIKGAVLEMQLQGADLEKQWATIVNAGDLLEPHAFYTCGKAIRQNPDAKMCYTDEDQMADDGKTYKDPVFKSDFNLDMLRATNYLGNMVLLRADMVSALKPWNPAYEDDAAYDYYIRAVEECMQQGAKWQNAVLHVPQVLYHTRERKKQQAHRFGEKILNAHYERQGIPATVKLSQTPGIYHTSYHWQDTPMVSVNIPSKDHTEDLDICVQSVLKNCKYPHYEIVIIENNSTQDKTFSYYEKIQKQDSRVRVIEWKDTYNYAKITNFGVAHSKGEYILLLNNDTEVIAPDFMEEMLGYCMREDVGVCGARLFYFDNTIQHAGVIVGLGGICGEGFQGFPKENGGYQNRIVCPQNYSAVTAACMMTKKSVFDAAGGMDEELQIAYNDIDYCLKVRRNGKLVVYNPFAMLHHYEYKSRGNEDTPEKLARYNREVDIFTTRWADMISAGDPYYNPNLTRRYQDFSLKRIELWK